MEEDGDPHSAVWKNPLMVYTKDPISAPLTTFTSDTLQTEALKLFKVSPELTRGLYYKTFSICDLRIFVPS
jgi:hypothetical protein